MMTIFWLVLAILFFVIEAVSLNLVTIWFLAGSVAAWILAAAGAPVWAQILVFAVLSVCLLLLLRPFAQSHINGKTTKTNTEAWIGRRVTVTKRVSGRDGEPGEAILNGIPWMAKACDERIRLEKGDTAIIAAIEGAALILQPDSQKAGSASVN